MLINYTLAVFPTVEHSQDLYNMLLDVELQYVHVMGKDNKVADLLSRWNNTQSDFASLKQFVASPIWAKVNHKYLELHNNL